MMKVHENSPLIDLVSSTIVQSITEREAMTRYNDFPVTLYNGQFYIVLLSRNTI